MPDITMNIDDTLELDTIIENSSRAKEPINVTEGSDYSLSGFQTHTGVFDPQSSGNYTIKVNEQELSVKVNESNTIPDLQAENWQSVSGSFTETNDYIQVSTTNTSTSSTVRTERVFNAGTTFEFDYWIYEHEKGVGIEIGPGDQSTGKFCGMYVGQGDSGSDTDNVIDIIAHDGNNFTTAEIGEINEQTVYSVTIDWNPGKKCTVTIDGVGSASLSSYVPTNDLPFTLHHQLGSSWNISRGRIYWS